MKTDATTLSKSEIAKREKIRQDGLDRIDTAKKSMVEDVVAIGGALADIQETFDAKEFIPWVQEHCEFEKSTAYNYIKVSKRFGKFKRLENFEASALYILAGCKDAAEKAMALANKGQFIGHERAKELVAEAKAAPADDEPIDVESTPSEPEFKPHDHNVAEMSKPHDGSGDDPDDFEDDLPAEEIEARASADHEAREVATEPARKAEPNLIGEVNEAVAAVLERAFKFPLPYRMAVAEHLRSQADALEAT
jgi:hypothetical protein